MDARQGRLKDLFFKVVLGKTTITAANSKTFLQSICSPAIGLDKASLFDKLCASQQGITALHSALRNHTDIRTLNKESADFLNFIRESEADLSNIGGGAVLQDLLVMLAETNIFFNSFLQSLLDKKLEEGAQIAFSWFFYQLCHLSAEKSKPYREHVHIQQTIDTFIKSPNVIVKTNGQQIQNILQTYQIHGRAPLPGGPGGRHSNDFEDFREISILPTTSELESTERPFLRTCDFLEDPETAEERVYLHLDNQFRLLREDLLYELKDDLAVARGQKKGFYRGVKVDGLQVVGIDYGGDKRRTKWSLVVQCTNGIPQLKNIGDVKKRKDYIIENRTRFLRHQSLVCLIAGGQPIGFPTINRDEDRLAKDPPEIMIQFNGKESLLEEALYKLKLEGTVSLIQIDTALFAYEPVLKRLQETNTLPLSSDLLMWTKDDTVSRVDLSYGLSTLVEDMEVNPGKDLKDVLMTKNSIKLDSSQAHSFISGLTQSVSLIQGPPGTGKSFIGALLAKALHKFTEKTILVVCYTNHALDDILTGLINIGIPAQDIVRLGGAHKTSSTIEPLLLQNQPRVSGRSRDQWTIIDKYRESGEAAISELERHFSKYRSANITLKELLVFLEFYDEDMSLYEALSIPQGEEDDIDDGFQRVAEGGKSAKETYLIDRWIKGYDLGIFSDDPKFQQHNCRRIWGMAKAARQDMYRTWTEVLLQEIIVGFCDKAHRYNRIQEKLKTCQGAGLIDTLKTKRVVGCTTTAAAKYCEELQGFSADILLVEEAGEILESHVLTSLSSDTEQIILIGDHKQLRPKVNNYELTVEKGEGYDLNRSLFERLILKDFPHDTLTQQHRMRPEISSFIRTLTYEDLLDAPSTQKRPDIVGLQNNVIFIQHDHPEDDLHQLSDRRDNLSKSSKQNTFEIEMVMKIVRYLGQQGYGTGDLVILTPYLGQLMKLRIMLKKDNDPILNDLDSAELVKAGLVDPSDAKLGKKPIHLSTIDNYQGEEADVVIISLTRSNPNRDIGFMSSPERLNVLLSRARNGMIIIGNLETFTNARKGKEMWQTFARMLQEGKHIYSGLPIKCDRHPDYTAIIDKPQAFDEVTPDGGCTRPCGITLSCGTHTCPSKCHVIADHSKMKCTVLVNSTCAQYHPVTYTCSDGIPPVCKKCERSAKLAREKQENEAKSEKRREEEQKAHLKQMDELEKEMEKLRQKREDQRLAREREISVRQKEADLAALRLQHATPTPITPQPVTRQSYPPQSPTPQVPEPTQGSTSSWLSWLLPSRDPNDPQTVTSSQMDGKDEPSTASPGGGVSQSQNEDVAQPSGPRPPSKPFPLIQPSPAKLEWEQEKRMKGVFNASVDAIMEMTGLESVKQEVLGMMRKIEVTLRQGTSLKSERLNVVFLGNPGTGKTTIARHYAKFLASVKAVPTDTFKETTGSRLAQDGVDGTQKMVDGMVQAGGGTIFIDEAYQLTSGNHYNGGAVLDFLLAEMENQVGKLVFILAGYDREMEKFFDHNPGLQSRVPHRFRFEDYKDEELMHMFLGILHTAYNGKMKLEDGYQGLFARVAMRRLGRRRGRPGFGNARELHNVFERIRKRQAIRLDKQRKAGIFPNDFLFTGEDIIGPNPSNALRESKAWKDLQKLTGLKAVKENVQSICDTIEENYRRELMEKEPLEMSFNRVLLGSPGTGKTTVGKLYGQILCDLGLLSNGEVIIKNPSDFVGAVIGASEANTKAILSNAMGKVLIIDEAYMLYGGGGDQGNNSNEFKTTVIDTIVAEVQNLPGEDRCILMLGYKEQMMDMFQNVNPGLSRRFKIEDAFQFDDFDNAELLEILNRKLYDIDLDATPHAKNVAIEVLSRMRNRPNFGNAGEVDNIISQAKMRCMTRRAKMLPAARPTDITFLPEDFDPEYNRGATASSNLAKLFEDVVGCDEVVDRLQGYQKMAQVCRARGMDPLDQIPTNFIFSGPPGTGKTTVARKMGEVFYDMGILGSKEVFECSASDMVGQYVGQTGPKTKRLFERALGKVLFVDEAYRLAEGHFAQEAMDELVGLLTHASFKGKLLVILAGYEDDMNRLLNVNSGLSSRFPHQIFFPNMDADRCLEVLARVVKKNVVVVENLEDNQSMDYLKMRELIRDLAELKDWGNARDMVTLGQNMVNASLLKDSNTTGTLQLSGKDAIGIIEAMKAEKIRRGKPSNRQRIVSPLPAQSFTPQPPTPPATATGTTTATAKPPPPPQPTSPPRSSSPATTRGRGRGRGAIRGRGRGSAPQSPMTTAAEITPEAQQGAARDPGVSDATWQRLKADERRQADMQQQVEKKLKDIENRMHAQRREADKQKKVMEAHDRAVAQARDEDERRKIQAEREAARLKAHAANVAKERLLKELREKKEEERRMKEKEEAAQKKLRSMGVCVAGFRWIRQGNEGYRCAGGTHFVSSAQLGV